MIHAPFNFVPLSDKVFFPDWADQISQDIPFSDGISGTIELKITAKTPIFVRNGHTKEDAENKNDEYKSFSKAPDGRYFIPATSVKGCIRSVLEILSFGKISLNNVGVNLNANHKKSSFDLAECIFGAALSDKSLRGRVLFSNAFCISEEVILVADNLQPYLGSPKPSYNPIYFDSNNNIRGWKRYLIDESYAKEFTNKLESNIFVPLDEGTEFKCRVNFHNLKELELGALLNAIEFGEDCCHSIGFAKPYGYGAVKIEITKITADKDVNKDHFKDAWVSDMLDYMCLSENDTTSREVLKNNIGKEYSVKKEELCLIASVHEELPDETFEYMNLNEYNLYKNNNERLPTYSEIVNMYSFGNQEDVTQEETPVVVERQQVEYFEAIVSVWTGNQKQARLADDKSNTKYEVKMDINSPRLKISIGTKITVEKVLSNKGKVKSLLLRKNKE